MFQPAEEGAPEGEEGGAGLMLKEGVFADFKPDAVFGLHVFSTLNANQIGVRAGPTMAASDRYGMTEMAVSVDGGPSEVFPRYLVDTGQFQAMGMGGKQVPALVLYDTVTKQPMPIGYGVMAADEVMDRIFTLTNVEPGKDF